MPHKNPKVRKAYLRKYDAARQQTVKRKRQIQQAERRWYRRNRNGILEKSRRAYKRHRQKELRRSRKYYREHSAKAIEAVLNSYYKKKFRMSLQDKKRMYEKQKGLCAACGQLLPKNFRKACLDHDHGTGIVRALIHWYCNHVVGHEENHPGILKKILRYVQKWKTKINS